MQYVTKLVKHGETTMHFTIPPSLSDKLSWRKDQIYRISVFKNEWIALEPIDPPEIARPVPELENNRECATFIQPCKRYKCFNFYLPAAIYRKLAMKGIILLTIHETGYKTIFLERLPHGT